MLCTLADDAIRSNPIGPNLSHKRRKHFLDNLKSSRTGVLVRGSAQFLSVGILLKSTEHLKLNKSQNAFLRTSVMNKFSDVPCEWKHSIVLGYPCVLLIFYSSPAFREAVKNYTKSVKSQGFFFISVAGYFLVIKIFHNFKLFGGRHQHASPPPRGCINVSLV